MRQSALKKEYEKFRQTIVDNLYVTFNSIPDGSTITNQKQPKTATDKVIIK